MKKIGDIDCGCSESCGSRINLFWSRGTGIIAMGPHGDETVEQHYSRHTYAKAVEDCIAMYDNAAWDLQLRS